MEITDEMIERANDELDRFFGFSNVPSFAGRRVLQAALNPPEPVSIIEQVAESMGGVALTAFGTQYKNRWDQATPFREHYKNLARAALKTILKDAIPINETDDGYDFGISFTKEEYELLHPEEREVTNPERDYDHVPKDDLEVRTQKAVDEINRRLDQNLAEIDKESKFIDIGGGFITIEQAERLLGWKEVE